MRDKILIAIMIIVLIIAIILGIYYHNKYICSQVTDMSWFFQHNCQKYFK